MNVKNILIGVAVIAVGYFVIKKAMGNKKTIIEDRGFQIAIEEQN